MSIANFPAALQPIIQQGFLEREFEQALRSRLGYRACADREEFAVGIGETLTKTRAGLLPAVTTPLVGGSNTNLDNGLSPTSWSVEQYTLTLHHYAATMDLNMVTSRVGIASQFLQNAYVNGEQAGRSLDDLARNALFSSYFGGNTRVRVTLGSAGPVVAVDDIRGFMTAFANGVQQPVSSANPLTVTVGADVYTLTGSSADAINVSTAPGGISGTLTFSTSVSVSDGTVGGTVQAATASLILRPNARTNTSALQVGDTLAMSNVLDAVAGLRLNAVPDIDGAYNCYLDPISARQLFADPDFQRLFIGATSANEIFRPGQGVINEFLGLRFVLTTESLVQTSTNIAGAVIRRPIVVGQGALIEGDFAGMAADDVAPKDSIVSLVDGVCMVTREPIDRLQQIIAQSWYWIGGFCTPSDTTTNALTVPTSTNASFKRAVMIEHLG
jgi:cytoskeletal protein CcmA (bactofilin family)